MESSLGPGPGGEAGRRGPQWAPGPAHTWTGGEQRHRGGEAADRGRTRRGGPAACSGLAAAWTGLSRGPPAPPMGAQGRDRVCPGSWGSQCSSCGLRACGMAHRERGPPPPPRSGSPPACPSHGHASLCPSRLVSSEEVRCVLVGSSVPGRGWRRSAGVESSARSPWGRAALPMASGALGLAGGTLHWTRGCRWGPRGLLSDLRNRDRCVFAAHVCPCLTIAITAR